MTKPGTRIRAVERADAESMGGIYNPYIRDTVITFEEELIGAKDMEARVGSIIATGHPWLVAEESGRVVGYAYAGPWKASSAYRLSAETTVYVDRGHGGRGVGSALYRELLAALKSAGIHAAIGGIALPNDPSTRLHERFGFRKVAQFPEVGFKFGRWIDVGYWQALL